MKLMIFGSRTFDDFDMFSKKMDEYLHYIDECGDYIEEVVHGGAVGTDSMAERFFKKRDIPTNVFLPDYKRWPGEVAPLKRNRQMVTYIAKESDAACICFWDGKSKGTEYTLHLLLQEGIHVNVFSTKKKVKGTQTVIME